MLISSPGRAGLAMACRAPRGGHWRACRPKSNADFDLPKTHFYLDLSVHCALEQEFRSPGQDPNGA